METGEPYLSVDFYYSLANIVVNPGTQHNAMFNAIEQYGNIPVVFIQTEIVAQYMSVLAVVRRPFVLITSCNDDICVPYMKTPCPIESIKYLTENLLKSPNLVRWFTKNPCIQHEKIYPLPLGPKFQYTSRQFFGEPKRPIMDILDKYCLKPADRFCGEKPELLYFYYGDTTKDPLISEHKNIRQKVREELLMANFRENGEKAFEGYMEELSRHKFCVSLPGRGVDTHRCWEALMVGTVPLMIHTALDRLYDKLPVILLPIDFDWSKMTREWLEEQWIRLHERSDYDFSILYSNYWREKITKS